jgi:hypothetical protein
MIGGARGERSRECLDQRNAISTRLWEMDAETICILKRSWNGRLAEKAFWYRRPPCMVLGPLLRRSGKAIGVSGIARSQLRRLC